MILVLLPVLSVKVGLSSAVLRVWSTIGKGHVNIIIRIQKL